MMQDGRERESSKLKDFVDIYDNDVSRSDLTAFIIEGLSVGFFYIYADGISYANFECFYCHFFRIRDIKFSVMLLQNLLVLLLCSFENLYMDKIDFYAIFSIY